MLFAFSHMLPWFVASKVPATQAGHNGAAQAVDVSLKALDFGRLDGSSNVSQTTQFGFRLS
jgi:hypothetical protein